MCVLFYCYICIDVSRRDNEQTMATRNLLRKESATRTARRGGPGAGKPKGRASLQAKAKRKRRCTNASADQKKYRTPMEQVRLLC